MKKIFKEKTALFSIVLFIIMIISMIVAVGIGPVSIDFIDVWKVILYKLGFKIAGIAHLENNIERIVWYLRLPRVILSAIVGSGLAIAGVSIQSFTKNPLSDPYILGISSGASTGAVAAVLTGVFNIFGIFAMPMGAFIGSLVAITFVYTLSRTKEGILPIRLILTGLAVSSIFSAFTNYLIYSSNNESGIRNAVFWMMGGLSGSKWIYIPVPLVVLIISIIVLFSLSNGLNTMLIGEQTAIVLGINIKFIRSIVVLLCALLTGTLVAISGSIGFVGLIVPHITRNFVGSDHRKVIPISSLLGALLIIWADVVARVIVSPEELPIGIVTALTGGPFFIWLLKCNRYSFGSE
ncbi:FecCD family ABC transporter permease [Clostridium rectalis]|uniref:FecCD family ABC transporter permease n=1 Tax=Clostridium rectalis TaxID=2040295 RepID=UPI000F632945|nr:iron chelate uptake ABC transporter family permease subunit [Clostridium rectalis]